MRQASAPQSLLEIVAYYPHLGSTQRYGERRGDQGQANGNFRNGCRIYSAPVSTCTYSFAEISVKPITPKRKFPDEPRHILAISAFAGSVPRDFWAA